HCRGPDHSTSPRSRSMSNLQAEFDRIAATVRLSSPTQAKWKALRAWLAETFALPVEEVNAVWLSEAGMEHSRLEQRWAQDAKQLLVVLTANQAAADAAV